MVQLPLVQLVILMWVKVPLSMLCAIKNQSEWLPCLVKQNIFKQFICRKTYSYVIAQDLFFLMLLQQDLKWYVMECSRLINCETIWVLSNLSLKECLNLCWSNYIQSRFLSGRMWVDLRVLCFFNPMRKSKDIQLGEGYRMKRKPRN